MRSGRTATQTLRLVAILISLPMTALVGSSDWLNSPYPLRTDELHGEVRAGDNSADENLVAIQVTRSDTGNWSVTEFREFAQIWDFHQDRLIAENASGDTP
jgi:hypothetical protein